MSHVTFLPFPMRLESGGEQIDKSIHETVSPYVLFSDPEKIGAIVKNHGGDRF